MLEGGLDRSIDPHTHLVISDAPYTPLVNRHKKSGSVQCGSEVALGIHLASERRGAPRALAIL